MGAEFLQANLTAGELTPELHARTDIERYKNGLSKATNMVILPYGGLRRRPGLAKITDTKVSADSRLIPFVFNTAQTYLLVIRPLAIDIYKDGVIQSTEVTPYTAEQIYDVDAIQSADTVIFAHELHAPRKLVRGLIHTDWTFSTITFTNQPTEWNITDGYPRTCTFFGNRLWFASSTQKPTSIWGSKISGFFDFGLGVGAADEGIADELDTNEFNIIKKIFAGRTLQAFTTGAEFYNSSTAITPESSSWAKQTGYGSSSIKPIFIDGATIFIDSSERTVRQYFYDYNEDGYVSLNASILSSHLITRAIAMDSIKGTQYDVGDYVYVVNEDGTAAVFNTMRKEEIAGWTPWETDGLFKDVCVLNKEVYFLVERNGSTFIELLTENTYTDHNVVQTGTKPTVANVVSGADNIVSGTDNIVHSDNSTGTLVYSLQTDYDTAFLTTEFKVVADFSIMDDQIPAGTDGNNTISVARGAYRLETGLNYKTNVTTLPISTESKAGETYHRRKRVVKVDINVIDSLGVYARKRFTGDRAFPVVLDEAPTPFTGFKEMYLLGYSRKTEIEITQEEPLPFLLRGLGYEIAY